MSKLFISDLHLSPQTPQIAHHFLALLTQQTPQISALYILGDLFEYWLGDDSIAQPHQPIINAIKQVSQQVPVYFMHGNRDFLIGEEFARQTGCEILNDPTVIDLYGTPTLLMHGDLLCTDDHDYMQFREQVRNPQWQAHFLSLSMDQRINLAKQARDASNTSAKQKTMEIMDTNQSTVEKYMRQYAVNQLIHGHTHRPALHQFNLDGKPAKRIVLGDWGEEASYLMASNDHSVLVDPRLGKIDV